MRALLLLLLILTWVPPSYEYNSPHCGSWPSNLVWLRHLGDRLSGGSHMYLTKNLVYGERCSGDDPYALAKGGFGICMQAAECANAHCNSTHHEENLPAAVVRVQTPRDIQLALQFANRHNIAVSVKTTGHSFQGSSSTPDSLLIWMAHYPKETTRSPTVAHNFTDSCGKTTKTVRVGGGENWDDVLEHVKDNYHLVTGNCRTVSAAGGWLQGGGLSSTSRKYGLGVDNVIAFEVVTADGQVLSADECSNGDLFWALRGGGGGTFGIVTAVEYKVHPPTPITVISWSFTPKFDEEGLSLVRNKTEFRSLVHLFQSYWVETSLRLSDDWAGHFKGSSLKLSCACPREQAMSEFGTQFIQWYWQEFRPSIFNTSAIASLAPSVWQAPSWYVARGGHSAYQNPNKTTRTGGGFLETYGARLMPNSVVKGKQEEVVDFFTDLTMNDDLTRNSYFLGGNGINGVPPDATAVHPAMRNAIYHITVSTQYGLDSLRKYLPNSITGVSFNHHNTYEPDWQSALWGNNYDRLLQIKDNYDPSGLLNCWHCVGYNESSHAPPQCPGKTQPPSKMPSLAPISSGSSSLRPSDGPSLVPVLSDQPV